MQGKRIRKIVGVGGGNSLPFHDAFIEPIVHLQVAR
jgi:hypothetical protein